MTTFLCDLLRFGVAYRKKIVILDRPNPLGRVVEGPGEVPWRHGLTVGELALYCNRHKMGKPADLLVVPLRRWQRTSLQVKSSFSKEQKPFSRCLQPIRLINPISIQKASIGRGERLLSGEKERLSKWETRYLKRLCWNLGLHCAESSGLSAGKDEMFMRGVKVSLKNDYNNFSAFNMLLTITRFLKNRKQITLSFEETFDRHVGSPAVRNYFQGIISFNQLQKEVEKSLQLFYDKSMRCCLYRPLPTIVHPKIVKI